MAFQMGVMFELARTDTPTWNAQDELVCWTFFVETCEQVHRTLTHGVPSSPLVNAKHCFAMRGRGFGDAGMTEERSRLRPTVHRDAEDAASIIFLSICASHLM